MKLPMNSVEVIALLHADPSASYWLKDAVKALCRRDPVDAWKDADTLAWIMKMRCEEVFQQNDLQAGMDAHANAEIAKAEAEEEAEERAAEERNEQAIVQGEARYRQSVLGDEA